jgi:hypothetical protein
METQNISAQLFVKQLPQAQLASFDGAKTDYNTNYLNTSVNYPESDRNIEETFQKQLDLSDYYKSVQVFDEMKKVFDTNEGNFNTTTNIAPDRNFKKNPFKGNILPVGPRDSVYDEPKDSLVNKAKESFGNVNMHSKESFGNVNKNYSNDSFFGLSTLSNMFGNCCCCCIIIIILILLLTRQ